MNENIKTYYRMTINFLKVVWDKVVRANDEMNLWAGIDTSDID